MKGQCYLLSLEEFLEGAERERYFWEAFNKVDGTRREKAQRMQSEKSRAACMGAGLLLQFAVQAALREAEREEPCVSIETAGDMLSQGREAAGYELAVYTVSQVLEQINETLELKMYYSGNGKPYLQDYPLYFNLSHSGNYVVCAVSPREVGVDIQEYRQVDMERLARRFFSEEEQSILTACANEKEQCKLFYQLWTRKEAYGKLTGEGIASVINKNMPRIKEGEPSVVGIGDDTPLFWQEWELDGHAITLCQYGI